MKLLLALAAAVVAPRAESGAGEPLEGQCLLQTQQMRAARAHLPGCSSMVQECHSQPAVHFLSDRDCHIFTSAERCKQRRRESAWIASVPGSGNTWVRSLLAQCTRVHTGAVYNDLTLKKVGYEGEGIMNPSRVLGIKTHAPFFGKAPRTGKALVVIRHPLDSGVSYAQYEMTQTHSVEAPESKLEDFFDKSLPNFLASWVRHTSYFLKQFPKEKRIFVKYEDIEANSTGKLIGDILPFLDVNPEDLAVRRAVCCAIEDSTQPKTTHREHKHEFPFRQEHFDLVAKIAGPLLSEFGYAAAPPRPVS